jgi:type IV pilus assembly protein PilP
MVQMSRLGKYTLSILIAVALAGTVSCGEDTPPAQQASVVKKKISAQKTAPAVQPAASAKTPPADAAGAPEATSADQGEPSPAEETSALVQESLKVASSYNPEGRFDPFEPLFKAEPSTAEPVAKKGKRKKRIPQTPLERVALSQLKLSAIMRTARGNSAIVEDATGKGYVIKKGTYIGLNSGQVVQIDKSKVVVEEELENVLGELIIQNTELKLQKPAGEL